jgi:hypothetical protein
MGFTASILPQENLLPQASRHTECVQEPAYLFQGIAWKHSGRELTGVCWKMALTHNFSRQHEAVFLKRDLSRLKQNASFSES